MISMYQRENYQIIVPDLALISGVSCAVVFRLKRGSLREDKVIAITRVLQPFSGSLAVGPRP